MSDKQQQGTGQQRRGRSLVIQTPEGSFYKIPQDRLQEFRLSDDDAKKFAAKFSQPSQAQASQQSSPLGSSSAGQPRPKPDPRRFGPYGPGPSGSRFGPRPSGQAGTAAQGGQSMGRRIIIHLMDE